MKPTSARLLSLLPLALAMALPVLAPVVGVRDAAALVLDAEQQCRVDLAAASRSYFESVLLARTRCQARVILGVIPISTNCVTGRGDDLLNLKLQKAEFKLTRAGQDCRNVNLQLLGFPGVCEDTTGDPFDTEDFKRCVVTDMGAIIARLMASYYPPITDFSRGSAARCLIGSAADASKSIRGLLRARERCMVEQMRGFVRSDADCREEILPYGIGTGDGRVDNWIGNAYVRLLAKIPRACVDVQIDGLGYQEGCFDPTGGAFTIFDLKSCFFGLNRDKALAALEIPFPSDPVCGDGNVGAGEECDLGIENNSDTKPDTCRTDCTLPKCHDGVKDPLRGEQCDDGNTIDGDCCSGECVQDVCGDGVTNCGEQCDNGAGNANTSDQCRATGPHACKNPRCGDGIQDFGRNEECDDGNTAINDGCNQFCQLEFCGDDEVQPALGEECDNGIDNGTDPDQCRPNCKNPRCGDGTTDPSNGEECDDGNTDPSDGCTNQCTICGNNVIKSGVEECDGTSIGTCAAGEGCNSSCECEQACPSVGELVLYAGSGQTCATNGDCPVGTCQTGRCRTVTRLDSGWVGLAHNSDINNGVRTRGLIQCASHGPTCGQCNVVGIDPSTGTCRCSNDTRKICDQPFQTDANDCGGAVCDCYFGAPFPLASGGTPACIVNRFAQNITGTANVDQGSGEITADLRAFVYLGLAVANPCPTCGGRCSNNNAQFCNRDQDCGAGTCNLDPVAEDGIRGGVCVNGVNSGESCDVSARNTSLPAFPSGPGGAGYSLDCLPPPDLNISGENGLIVQLTQSTGTSTLTSEVECSETLGATKCACKQCTFDPTVPCHSDAECSATQPSVCTGATSGTVTCTNNAECSSANIGPCRQVGSNPANTRCDKELTIRCANNTECQNRNVAPCNPSTCSSTGVGEAPQPNDCTNLQCSDIGGGKGQCTTGPNDTFCEGVVKADGGGVYACNSNAGCSPSSIGVDGGLCALVVRRPCLLDPIVATGAAHPSFPVGAATFCIPPTTNAGINKVAGLPGPGRILNQASAKTFCGNKPTQQYIPGVGGCLGD
jgi:cysteine-rich repeat protein